MYDLIPESCYTMEGSDILAFVLIIIQFLKFSFICVAELPLNIKVPIGLYDLLAEEYICLD